MWRSLRLWMLARQLRRPIEPEEPKESTLKQLAQETLEILRAGAYCTASGRSVNLADAQRRAVEGTELCMPGPLPKRAVESTLPIEITDETTQAAALRLWRETGAVALLNFGSGTQPGGGFLQGALAQEEDLARSSGLYPCLLKQRNYYAYHRDDGGHLYSDRLLYSPLVPFFRTDTSLLEEPFLAGVITAAAPHAFQAGLAGFSAQQIEAVYRQRVGHILALAQRKGHRTLVLGAWGCGAFQNDPIMAADAFGEWLEGHFRSAFDQIVFAIYESGMRGPLYHAFNARFRQAE